MFNRKEFAILIGTISIIAALEALTEGLKKEEYCIMNREPDIPAEHSFPSLSLVGSVTAGTTSSTISGDMVNL